MITEQYVEELKGQGRDNSVDIEMLVGITGLNW